MRNPRLSVRLKRGDKAKRLRFCRWALAKWRCHRFWRCLIMSDEANICLDGTINKHNVRVWGIENMPHMSKKDEALL